MPNIQVTNSYVPNTRILSSAVNQNFNDVVNILKANHHDIASYANAAPITNSGIAPNAQILDTQLKTPITRSGLISDSALQAISTAGKVANTALPYDLVAHRFSTKAEVGDANTYVNKDATGEMAFTDIINGTKKISELGAKKFGGTGADGALAISSGTTTIDLGGARVFIKNYSSISITGTGKLAFTNPHASGTFKLIRSQGNTVLTSSTVPCIDASALGAAGGIGNTGSNGDGTAGTGGSGPFIATGAGGGGGAGNGAAGTAGVYGFNVIDRLLWIYNQAFVGAGGGGGGRDNSPGGGSPIGGDGGRGGGCLIIECAGDLNFTGTVSVAGGAGANGTVNGSYAGNVAGGGGGGSGGFVAILYNTATSTAGTLTVSGGAAGTTNASTSPGNTRGGGGGGGGYNAAGTVASNGNGGAGATGVSIISTNIELS